MISTEPAPQHVVDALAKLKATSVDNVEQYFDHMVPYDPDDVDPFDPSIPGCSEDWILNRDRTTVVWDGADTLERNEFSNVRQIHRPGYSIQKAVIDWLLTLPEFAGKRFNNLSGRFYYPEGGFMGWHTNSDAPGIRVYLAYASAENASYFRYYDNNTDQVVTDWDGLGWNIRAFDIVDDPNQFYWHCVYAGKPRWSFGFHFV